MRSGRSPLVSVERVRISTSPELRAERDNGSVTITGRKSFVTSGGNADHYLVLVQGEAAGTSDAYLVDGDGAG